MFGNKIEVLKKFIPTLLGVLLLVLYSVNIQDICTVWQLGDEAGYLANCAYILGYDWDDVRAVTPFYGYGYSILLIPIFILSQSGVALIQGAIGINIICVLGIYFLQIYILEKLYGKNKKTTYASIAFISCICPYIVANTYMVVCEVFLTFWFLLLAVLLYKAIEERKKINFIVLGICSAYSFFIHTRSFVVIFAVVLTVFILGVKERGKNNILNFIYLIVTIIIFFLIFYQVKAAIVNSAKVLSSSISEDMTSINLITPMYLFERIKWLFCVENIKYYFLSFIAKIFYTIYATGGMAIYGGIDLVVHIKAKSKEDNLKNNTGWYICFFFLICVISMVFVCTINGAGMLEDFTTFFYNRYYEYTVWPVVSIGIYQFISKKQGVKKGLWSIVLLTIMCILIMSLNDFLHSSEIHSDIFRIASFSEAVSRNGDFISLILYITLITILIISINYGLNFRCRRAILIVLFMFIGCSSLENIKIIKDINKKAESDTRIAEYILAADDEKEVYMIDEPYKYSGFYSRMQVLIKNKRLYVIEPTEINTVNSGDFLLVYYTSDYHDIILEENECIMRGRVFDLYKKR